MGAPSEASNSTGGRLSLKTLLEVHSAIYKAESEARFAAWLRQEIQAGLNLAPQEAADRGQFAGPAIPISTLSGQAGTSADKHLSPGELVARLDGRVTQKTLANWRSAKRRPYYIRIGGRVAYLQSEVDAWLDELARNGGGKR